MWDDQSTGLLGLGLLILTGSAAIALEQVITYGGWEEKQMLIPFHHEGISLWGIIIGTTLVGVATLKAGEN